MFRGLGHENGSYFFVNRVTESIGYFVNPNVNKISTRTFFAVFFKFIDKQIQVCAVPGLSSS